MTFQPIVAWPPLELTPAEREVVSHYATPAKPGVLRRTYGASLLISNIPGDVQAPQQLVSFSGRRIRVFGLTLSGDIEAYKLSISNPAGVKFTNGLVSVASLLNSMGDLSTFDMIPEWTTAAGAGIPYLSKTGYLPILFDPNIVIEGTDSLIFEGELGGPWLARAQPPISPPGSLYRGVLNIGIHCWEFPEWPRERPFAKSSGAVGNRMVKGVR